MRKGPTGTHEEGGSVYRAKRAPTSTRRGRENALTAKDPNRRPLPLPPPPPRRSIAMQAASYRADACVSILLKDSSALRRFRLDSIGEHGTK
ncbi:unnamed protein product [Lasius platythorax]|uniref:Uncharacterized protein n=1 Tax=Lasius platythorax TaxID=488582 RepID=A0AAV2N843_9HYME